MKLAGGPYIAADGESLPAWECGLKYGFAECDRCLVVVTPCVGVWIEIHKGIQHRAAFMSLPAWECGLKCHVLAVLEFLRPSLPAWECGLKFDDFGLVGLGRVVTPCVGVWIEIRYCRRASQSRKVTPCVGVWIEIL